MSEEDDRLTQLEEVLGEAHRQRTGLPPRMPGTWPSWVMAEVRRAAFQQEAHEEMLLRQIWRGAAAAVTVAAAVVAYTLTYGLDGNAAAGLLADPLTLELLLHR